MKVDVIGAGLAGCEAAFTLANHGVEVRLIDIKPKKFTPAHSDKNLCELVCSNSLKSNDVYGNACGLLKEEMRLLGSVTMEAAEETKVPAGGALAVDRTRFSEYVTQKLRENKNIQFVCEEVTSIPETYCIIATGPLTSGALAEDIAKKCGTLCFYDASAPIVSADSLDYDNCFTGDRYGRGNGDYINCPLTKEQYKDFVSSLLSAERVTLKDFEKREIFEGCMPIEVMAERGEDSLRFANFKPVGITDDEGNKFYAVLQLRKENIGGSAYNLVGCQTNLKFGEQKRVFSIIPALKNAEFLRYGVMHRNTFINSPECLNADFSLKSNRQVFFAGQITGVEGYVESAASGIIAAISLLRKLEGKPTLVPDDTTICGALCRHISTENKNFQPMNANYGILRAMENRIKDKRARNEFLSRRALDSIKNYIQKLDECN